MTDLFRLPTGALVQMLVPQLRTAQRCSRLLAFVLLVIARFKIFDFTKAPNCLPLRLCLH